MSTRIHTNTDKLCPHTPSLVTHTRVPVYALASFYQNYKASQTPTVFHTLNNIELNRYHLKNHDSSKKKKVITVSELL